MELIEREKLLALLETHFSSVADGEGHCLFVNGEAGIGKTALIKAFCKQHAEDSLVYRGACDALLTPRPLAPLYDILWQVNKDRWSVAPALEDRSALFINFLQELSAKKDPVLIVFEDIHWADEGTLDFMKFFAKRISQLRCLFILTYREEELHSRRMLRNVLGELPADSFTKITVTPLSKLAVEKMAAEKGYSGEDVYTITGGNPFYVNEILASYSPGVPDTIKDSILAVYERQKEGTKHAWEICSVIPGGIEIGRFAKLKASWDEAMDHCFAMNVIIIQNNKIVFKHELYRRTIEESLAPSKRVTLNKMILDLFLESFEENEEIERIVHFAKNADEYQLVAHYAPIAAARSACVGAHLEAARLYHCAIEYYRGDDSDMLIRFYESYAYECYLTNQIGEAISYTVKSLDLWKEKNDTEKTGNSLRLLSRLWWLESNQDKSETFARQAIELMNDSRSSPVKAMVFSNMSQIKLLSDQYEECISWAEKAIAVAREVSDDESLSHALNNIGSVYMNIPSSKQQGVDMLQQSLEIALNNSFHEHAARAYANLAGNAVQLKDYTFAKNILDKGIAYCEDRDLYSWRLNMLSLKALVHLETGEWDKAYRIADQLLRIEDEPRAFKINALLVAGKIKMRTGNAHALPLLLEAKSRAFNTTELQRIIPSLTALLECEWLTGKTYIEDEELDWPIRSLEQSIDRVEKSELAFWLLKARKQQVPFKELTEGYKTNTVANAQKAAAFWRKSGCSYAEALALFDGNEEDKKNALLIFQQLGASAIAEKIKMEMRAEGIKKIPRGLRESTKTNPAQLTNRELDIIRLLQKAIQNKEIASTLFISPKTVDHHISNIFFKLDVNSRSKAVTEAIRLGIIE